jgi:hypothetical protein
MPKWIHVPGTPKWRSGTTYRSNDACSPAVREAGVGRSVARGWGPDVVGVVAKMMILLVRDHRRTGAS